MGRRGEVRHWPFESKYLRDFEVVEERRDGYRLFPHTEQLPLLSKVINDEFQRGLTTRLAKTDARADEWRKLCLWNIAGSFCNFLGVARPDHLHVQPFLTPDRVARIALVQQISRTTDGGLQHTFRYFHGTQFLPDVHLVGKRPVFSSHAIDRFAQRINVSNGHAVNFLLTEFFATPPVLLKLDGSAGVAAAYLAGESMAAMPFEMYDDEVLFLTTLSPNEISDAVAPHKPTRMHLHFGPEYTKPAAHNFNHVALTEQILQRWRAKTPRADLRKLFEEMQAFSLTRIVQETDGILRQQGYHEGSKLAFLDEVYGPVVLTLTPLPGKPEPAPSPATPPVTPAMQSTADHAALAPRWPIVPPRGKTPGTVSDEVQRNELMQALTEFLQAMGDDMKRHDFFKRPDDPRWPVARARYRQTIFRAAAQGVELSLTWYILATCTHDGEERIDYFTRALKCMRAENAARPEPLTDEIRWSTLNTEAECLFEIAKTHYNEGAPVVAREFLEQALPLARRADALSEKAGKGKGEMEGRIAELLRQVPPPAPATPTT